MKRLAPRATGLFILLIYLPTIVCAQDSGAALPESLPADPSVTEISRADSPGNRPLPRGFLSLSLGTSLEEAKTLLAAEAMFTYRGDPDISMRPFDNQPIINSGGTGMMESGTFQFRDDRLYSITLEIDPRQMDYFTMYRDLVSKYGEPDYLDPELSYWEQDGVRMTLEKPVTVKYISMDVFNEIREAGAAQESLLDISRELFLDNF